MKQEDQVGSLNNCIGELQQQACAQRSELQDAHHGYVESRREQVRLHEQFIYEGKGSPKYSFPKCARLGRTEERVQELRVDELTVKKVREKH